MRLQRGEGTQAKGAKEERRRCTCRLEGAKLLREGLNNSQIARKLGVSRQAVIKWKRHLKRRSSLAKKPFGRRPVILTKRQLAILREEIKKRPEHCLPEEYFFRT